MAPGRKRGGKGSKAKCELSLGDLVLAKVKGFPAWPAKISRPEDWNRTGDPKKHFVQFFGTAEIAFVAPADILEFTAEVKNKLSARCKGKTVKYFTQAVEEISEAFEELQRRKSNGGRDDDSDRPAFVPEAPADMALDDNVEIDLKDRIVTNDLNGDTGGKGIADDGCCSPVQDKMNGQDIKSPISYDVKDILSSVVLGRSSELSSDDAELPLKEEEKVSRSSPCNLSYNEEAFCDYETKDKVTCSTQSGSPIEGLSAVQNSPSPLVTSSHVEKPKKELINRRKSKKASTRAKIKSDCPLQENRISSPASLASPAACDNSTCHDLPVNVKHKIRKKEASSPPILKSKGDSVGGKKAKGDSKGMDQVEVSGRKNRAQVGKEKHNLVSNEVVHKVKRSKNEDTATDANKVPLQTNNVLHRIVGNAEIQGSTLLEKTENHLNLNVSSDQDSLPPTKRRRRAPEAISEEKKGKFSTVVENGLSHSDKVKSPGTKLHSKRRAVRLMDDSDEETKAPVHGGSDRRVDASSNVSDSNKITQAKSGSSAPDQLNEGVSRELSSKEFLSTTKLLNETLLPSPQRNVARTKKAMAANVSPSPPNLESEKISDKTDKSALVSPRLSVADAKLVVEPVKAVKSLGKVSVNVTQKKVQIGSNKGSIVVSNGLNLSQSQAANGRSKPTSSGQKQRSISKPISRLNDSTPVAREPLENNSLPSERLEADRDDQANSLKHLIEVAKRRQAHSQNLPHGNSHGYSSSLLVPSQSYHLPATSVMQLDVHGYHPRPSLGSPSSHVNQYSLSNQTDIEQLGERRASSGRHPAGGSLSGGTEAAVARDAFEGMIETLSRTKDSIGRATRLAIDCAKYGIADEVVELLIRKLETEPSFHRRVDLFFLVDSITQCSHSHKGIAGASYIPTVEAALPRLLGAAAPPGAAALENRHQCHKVLRLWLQRKIFPESLLRGYMEEIGVSKDDPSAGLYQRRSSRAERSIDDPVRDMEGMLVDEYGSNAAFQLPGLLSSHVFEEEEDDDDGLRNTSDDVAAGERSPVETTTTAREESVTPPNDSRRHCILEEVDGELEMEDVSAPPPKEVETDPSFETLSPQQGSGEQPATNNYKQSPPLPVGSPPSTPPVPSSPPPPAPPLSPLTLPPPPPLPPPVPSLQHPLAPPPPPLSVLPQPSLPPLPTQHLHPFPSSPSPNLLYQQHPLPHDCNGAEASVNQLTHVPQQSPCFVPQSSQPNHQFHQPGKPPVPSLNPHGHFPYSNPRVQQYPPQHQYPPPYSLPNHHHDGPRRYVAEDQWRMPSNANGPRGVWLNGGRASSTSGPSFPQEAGYFRPPPTSNVGFQPNIIPVGASSTAGPVVPQMMPCRPDMPPHNCWRPV